MGTGKTACSCVVPEGTLFGLKRLCLVRRGWTMTAEGGLREEKEKQRSREHDNAKRSNEGGGEELEKGGGGGVEGEGGGEGGRT